MGAVASSSDRRLACERGVVIDACVARIGRETVVREDLQSGRSSPTVPHRPEARQVAGMLITVNGAWSAWDS